MNQKVIKDTKQILVKRATQMTLGNVKTILKAVFFPTTSLHCFNCF